MIINGWQTQTINLVTLISYLFGSFGLWRIFQRLGEANAWFAWIWPLCLWKLYQAGGQSPWWMIGLFFHLTVGETSPWLDWVPFLGMWKLYQAGDSWFLWIIGLPILLINLAALTILVKALVKMVQRLGKNPWMILLLLLPLVNLWVMYHFAFQ